MKYLITLQHKVPNSFKESTLKVYKEIGSLTLMAIYCLVQPDYYRALLYVFRWQRKSVCGG